MQTLGYVSRGPISSSLESLKAKLVVDESSFFRIRAWVIGGFAFQGFYKRERGRFTNSMLLPAQP